MKSKNEYGHTHVQALLTRASTIENRASCECAKLSCHNSHNGQIPHPTTWNSACKQSSCARSLRSRVAHVKNETCSPDCLFPAVPVAPLKAQTFEVNGQPAQLAGYTQAKQKKQSQTAQANASGDNGIGWGSSIEVGRLARAAEDALRHGNPSGRSRLRSSAP